MEHPAGGDSAGADRRGPHPPGGREGHVPPLVHAVCQPRPHGEPGRVRDGRAGEGVRVPRVL